MKYLFRFLLPAALLLAASLAHAETATINLQYITPQEAANLAQTQLSSKGHVVVMTSRPTIVIDDDAKHVAAARALIRRLDVAPTSLQVELQLDTVQQDDISSLTAHGRELPGGWLRLRTDGASLDTYSDQNFELRIVPGQGGRIEAGTVQPNTVDLQQWLASHGIPESESIEAVPITAGFNVEAHMAGSRRARVALHPWIHRQQENGGISGQTQVLVGLGTTGSPSTPPSTTSPTLRVYGQPTNATDLNEIRISEADTDVEVPLDRWVTIGAVRASADRFGQALLSGQPNGAYMDVLIRMRVKRVR